ncbi:MAG: DUF2788 domain-containing protein [Chromatiales bacterium]|jgi:hypothetical protein
MITDQMLTDYALPVLLSALMLYMLFIIYNLGRKSNAGKYGMFVMYLGLSVGIFGFVMKYVINFFVGQTI